MDLQILIRGQSNAILLTEGDDWTGASRLTSEVQRLLGFDGVTDRVEVLYSQGGTAHGGTAFLGEWMALGAGGDWAPTALGSGLLRSAGELDDPAAAATAVLWLHNEYDSRRADLSSAEWAAAVRQDAALLRGALGGDAEGVPYHFVSAIPYSEGSPGGHQAIRSGMEALAADPAFNASVAARALDVDMALDDRDGDWGTVDHGGGHMSPGDALAIADRAARAIAEDWSDHARPGSPVFLAGGDIPDVGPRVLAAERTGPDTLRLTVAQDAAGGFAPLDPDAAGGVGWEVSGAPGAAPGAAPTAARAASVVDADTVDLFFAGPLPEAGGVLHYGWGYGRLAKDGGPGRGNAITDDSGLPIWTPAEGVAIGAPAAANDGPWLA